MAEMLELSILDFIYLFIYFIIEMEPLEWDHSNTRRVIFSYQYKKFIPMVKIKMTHWNKNDKVIKTNTDLNGT